jgi:hypothetical protein
MQTQGVKLAGHTGTWSAIDEYRNGVSNYYLMESDNYGDEAAAVIIDGNGDVICETHDDIKTALRGEGLAN